MLPAVLFSIGSSAMSWRPAQDALGSLAKQLVAVQHDAAGAAGVLALRGEMAEGALDALVGNPERRPIEIADVALLRGDRHLDQQAEDAFGLVRVEVEFGGDCAHSRQQLLLAQLVPEREGSRDLGAGDFPRQLDASAKAAQQVAVNLLQLLAYRLEIGRQVMLGGFGHHVLGFRGSGGRGRGVYGASPGAAGSPP